MRTASFRAAAARGLLVLAMTAVAGAAGAADHATEAKWRKACWKDAFSMCTFHAIGGERAAVRDCLLRNISRISPACRDVIEQAHAQGVKGVDAPEDNGPPGRMNVVH
jgi:hypothetical protein